MLTIDQYLQRRLTETFVRTAAKSSARIAKSLAEISEEVRRRPAALLVAIWGMESNFGRFTGTRPTVQALATLAWEGRRGAFFTAS